MLNDCETLYDVKYPVIEIFGPTIQGEGPAVGMRTMFIRFAGCDYFCPWCDSKETWRIKNGTEMFGSDIIKQLQEADCSRVVLTGGNPCIHELGTLVKDLKELRYEIHVETQGSIYQPWLRDCDEIVISPKKDLFDEWEHTKLEWYRLIKDASVSFKFVIGEHKDYYIAENFYGRFTKDAEGYGLKPQWFLSVMNNSTIEGLDSARRYVASKYEEVVDYVIHDNSEFAQVAKVFPQQHVIIWGNKKGV